MKRKLILASAVAALMFGTVTIGYGADARQHPDPFLGQMSKALDLTSSQQTQIKAILKAEADADATLRQQQADLRTQLRQAEWATSYDEASVAAIAASLAQVEQELTVSRTKAHFQVNSLLTATQRTLAQKLEPDSERRPGPPPLP